MTQRPHAVVGRPAAADPYAPLSAALPPGDLDGAVQSALRLRSQLAESGGTEGRVVLVAYGGGKDSSFAVAFVRCMQLVLKRLYGNTFNLRVATNRHAGMPRAVMENIDRVYRVLGLYGDPDCELLCIDGDDVFPFDVSLPLPAHLVERNRLDILMTGHRAAGDGRPTFCNACNLSMARSFSIACSYESGVDVVVTGDSLEEQGMYIRWITKLARDFHAESPGTKRRGFNRVLELTDGISREYFSDVHGEPDGSAKAYVNGPAAKDRPTFFSIYGQVGYSSRDHWDFLTGYLGFVFDDVAFSFSESDCGNPGLMAHIRGLKCERVDGHSYALGLAQYIEFATQLMREKDFPAILIEAMQERYAGELGIKLMRRLMDRYAQDAYGLSEEQLVCMAYAPFVDEGAGLDEYVRNERPAYAGDVSLMRSLLDGTAQTHPHSKLPQLRETLERCSGLPLRKLQVLYRRPRIQYDPARASSGILDAILAGDPHKRVLPTTAPGGREVYQVISGR